MPIGYADVTPWPVVRVEDGVEAGREDPHPTSPVKTGEGKRIVGALKVKRAAGTAPKPVLKSQPGQGVVVIASRYRQGRNSKAWTGTHSLLFPGEGRGRDCQDFRVWPGIMGNKESPHVTTQRTCHTE